MTDALIAKFQADQKKITWESDRFKKFAVIILSYLEPRHLQTQEHIYEQN